MHFSFSRFCTVAAALAAGTDALPQPQTGDDGSSTACNNAASLCSKRYNEVTYLGPHNSYALRDDSTNDSLAGNQFLNATVALDAGLRLLQAQTHQGNALLELCHTSCDLLDAGPLEDWLALINGWLDNNPNEVITLVIVNADSAPASAFASALQNSGIGAKAYTASAPGPATTWPTLQSMIDANTRVVTFVTNVEFSAASPAILPEFDFVFETPFEVTEISGFNCTLDRPGDVGTAQAALSANYLSLVNHFKYQQITEGVLLPDVSSLETVNSADATEQGALGTHIDQCSSQWGTVPNFVLVDFWDEGDALTAIDQMNSVASATGRSTDGSGSGGGGGGGSAAARYSMDYGALAIMVMAAAWQAWM